MSQSKKARTHAESQSHVCLLCFQKGSSMLKIANVNLQRVKKYFLEDFDPNDSKLPNRICTRCRNLLGKVENGSKIVSDLPDPVDFNALSFPKITRTLGTTTLGELVGCTCSICIVANTVQTANNFKKPFKKGRPLNQGPSRLAMALPVRRCNCCLQIIGKGINHPQPCGLRDRRENVTRIVLDDQRGAEIIASHVIKEKVKDSSKDQTAISLATKGPSVSLPKPNPSPSKESEALYKDKPVPASEIQKMMVTQNMSLNQVGKQLFMDRTFHGRKSIEPGCIGKLQEMDKTLQPFFSSTTAEFDSSNKDERSQGIKVKRSVVYCNNLPGLLELVTNARGNTKDDCWQKTGMDGGGDFLKICLNIEKNEKSVPSTEKKPRFTYSEGAFASKYKDSGVKKLLILAIVEDIVENYANLKILLDLLKINDVEYINAFDMKLANSYIGVGTAASTYPCAWCELPKRDFDKEEHMFSGGNLRTLGKIRENAKAYQEAAAKHKGKNKLSSAKYLNCENQPLCNRDDSTTVLKVIPPMELHCHLGATNKLYDELDNSLLKAGASKTAKDWSNLVGVSRPKMHGGEFNGDQCSSLLNRLDWIKDLIEEENLDDTVKSTYEAFLSFKSVKDSCFGNTCDSDYLEHIKDFGSKYLRLNIGIPPKIHCILVHVPQFLADKEGKGLGVWSEQASESVHHDFSSLWAAGSYKRALCHKDYESQLYKCVVTYNLRHI